MQFATDKQGRLIIPRPSKAMLREWGAPIPASSWRDDLILDHMRYIDSLRVRSEGEIKDIDTTDLRKRALALAALIEAGPDGVTYDRAPRKV
jgi:hypothetical protein